ncbi:hydrolases of the HAD superfamily [Candidatus Scalindua japonica]|uniref:Hydrolases of the HAD superfamily n=1 Tax=Candidatus Scalindua japonica TaxID=1284222 RepID=A0A286TZG2_9BACT|nr:DUF1302 family protein [Candidatus Scalindua japonica]GAX61285.1 hydrolases of the HAD superfamily [Candidatus Scalindua japonica]
MLDKRIFRSIVLCLIINLLIHNGYSQGLEENSETDIISKRQYVITERLENIYSSFRDIFDGYIEYRNFTYFRYDASDDKINRAEGIFKLEYEKYLGNLGKILVSPKLIFDNDNYSSSYIDEFENRGVRRLSFDLEEYYAEFNFNSFDLKIGKQIFSWGKADGFNPTDNLNPRDYIDLFVEEEKIGVPAINLTYYWKNFTFDFVFIPTYTPTRLPLINARHSFLDPETQFVINGRELPADKLSSSQTAIRILRHISGWDLSVSYYDGYDDLTLATVESDQSLTPRYNRTRVVGVDLATTFGGLGIHGEAAQFFYDGSKDEDYLQYILGIDYTWTNVIYDHDIFLILEYMGDNTTQSREDKRPAFASGLGRVFRNSLLSTITYKFSETFELETKLANNLDHHMSYVINPEINYDITDELKLTVGIDFIEGTQTTFFGQFDNDDRGYFFLRYSF